MTNDPRPERSHALSPRELEVLQLLCAGWTARAIGEALGISGGTVTNRRQTIYQKLGVTHLGQACEAYGRLLAEKEVARRPRPAAMAERPRIRTSPVRDAEFRAFVRAEVTARPSWDRATELEDHLRQTYPSATVRVHAPDRGPTVWYVFRASHLVTPSDEVWDPDPRDAWLTYDHDAVLVDLSPAAEALLATDRDAEVGRSLFDTIVGWTSRAQEDVHQFWEMLQRRGSLRSSMRIPRRDGIFIDIDFLAEADEDAPGYYRAILRPTRPASQA